MVVQSQDAFGFAGPSGMYKVSRQAHHDSMHNSVVKAPNCTYLRNHGLECSTQAGHFIHLSSINNVSRRGYHPECLLLSENVLTVDEISEV